MDTTATNVMLQPQGKVGLKQWSGILSEEPLRDLIGTKAREVFEEMGHDGVVGGVLRAFDVLIRGVNWRTEPATWAPQDIEIADFIEGCRSDMEQPWDEFISEVGSCWKFGWSFHEVEKKYRLGAQPDYSGDLVNPALTNGGIVQTGLKRSSRFNDGKVGWAGFPIRSQQSLFRWVFDEYDNVLAMQQRPAPSFDLRAIPMSTAMLFRTVSQRKNPEGVSLLRSAYTSWAMKKRLIVLEAIWVERMCGYPILWAPGELFAADATEAQKARLAAAQDTVSKLKVHELMGMVMPLVYDETTGNKLWDLTTLQVPSGNDLGIGEMIQRYDRDIAISMLAGVILLGHQRQGTTTVGSMASSSMTDLLTAGLVAYLDMIEEVLNAESGPVTRLLRLNAMPTEDPPRIRHGDITLPNLAELGQYISALSGAGAQLFPSADNQLENELLERAKLPKLALFEEDTVPRKKPNPADPADDKDVDPSEEEL